MIQYLDSSSVLKILFKEEHSQALANYLGGILVSSDLLKLEVTRSIINRKSDNIEASKYLFSKCYFIPISQKIVLSAQELDFGIAIRSLDAIHLASALNLIGLEFEVITYDKRLIRVCELAGVKVVSPN